MKAKNYRSRTGEKRLRQAARSWQAAEPGRRLQRRSLNVWISGGAFLLFVGIVIAPWGFSLAMWEGEVTEWRVSWYIVVSALFLLPGTAVSFVPDYAEQLTFLPVTHRQIADESLRRWRCWILAGLVFWFPICLGMPAEGSGWSERVVAGLIGGAGFVCAGAMWWLGARIPLQYSWPVPLLLVVLLILDLLKHEWPRFFWVADALEAGAVVLPWQWAFLELRESNPAAFLPWLVLLIATAIVWMRWVHQRIRALFVFDRFDEALVLDEEEFDEWEDDEAFCQTRFGPDLNAFSPADPATLGWLERKLWRWLSPGQRWIANIGGLGEENFLRRLGWALLAGAVSVGLLVLTHFEWGEWIGQWFPLALAVAGTLAAPWGATNTTRWTSPICVGMSVSSPLFQFYPLSLRDLLAFRAKELLLKVAVATPVLALLVIVGRHSFDRAPLWNLWPFVWILPLVFVGSLAFGLLGFANTIVAAAFSRKTRGRGLRFLVQCFEVTLFLAGFACALVAVFYGVGRTQAVPVDMLLSLLVWVLVNVWVLKALIKKRLRDPRCDVIIGG